MGYIGKNPKVKTVVLEDVGLTSQTNPASGSHKLVNRGGTVKVLDSAGNEASLGGGSGEINVIDNSSDSGNWAASGAGITVATTTTATDLPLGGVVDTAIKLTPVSGTDYARYRFSMPASLKNKKLKIEWHQRPLSGYASGDLKVEIYKNSASNYGGSYTEFNLTTDVSGTSAIANATGKFTTYFDSDDGDYYELRIVRVAGTTALNIASVIVGPGTQPQGAVVGEWQSYTPTGSWTTNTTYTGKYRRIGSDVELKINIYLAGQPNNITLSFTSPQLLNGLGISYAGDFEDKTGEIKAPYGSWAGTDAALNDYIGTFINVDAGNNTTTFQLQFQRHDVQNINLVNQTQPFAWNVNDNLTIIAKIPIAEWAGSGTVNVAQNDVEYAAWNGTTTVYGPRGANFPGTVSSAVATRTTHNVTWQRAMQPSDVVLLEYNAFPGNESTWIEVGSSAGDSNLQVSKFTGQSTGASPRYYGLGYRNNSATVTSVEFGDAGMAPAAIGSYGSVGFNWDSTYRYRLRKISAGAAVGFGIVQPGVSSGLVSASGLPGNTTGNAIASSYVGEVLSNSWTGVSVGTSITALGTLTGVTPGHYIITVTTDVSKGSATRIISDLSGTATTVLYSSGGWGAQYLLSDTGLNLLNTFSVIARVTASGTIVFRSQVVSGSATPADSRGTIAAVRIA